MRNQKLQLLSLWCVCQPWIREGKCLSIIPFARNTDANAHILSQLDTLQDAAACIGSMISGDSVHNVLANNECESRWRLDQVSGFTLFLIVIYTLKVEQWTRVSSNAGYWQARRTVLALYARCGPGCHSACCGLQPQPGARRTPRRPARQWSTTGMRTPIQALLWSTIILLGDVGRNGRPA